MYRPCLTRCGWSALLTLLLVFLISGCGDDDKPTNPTPRPALSMSLECNGGLADLTVSNSGAAMSEPSRFIAAFADGHIDTLMLTLGQRDTTMCQLSNIHGEVTVTNDQWDLEVSAGECLLSYFQNFITSFNLGSIVPSLIGEIPVGLCTYSIYIANLTSAPPTVELIPTDDGLTLRCVYTNITSDLSITSPGILCPNASGNMAVASVVAEIDFDISSGDDPQVTVGDTRTTINGLQVDLEGIVGFIIELIIGVIQNNLTATIEDEITAAINASVGPDLGNLVIVNTACAE